MGTLTGKEIAISVIIPSLNPDLSALMTCLTAVHAARPQPLEVILVDDGSAIDYSGKVAAYGRVIRNETNLGPASARNRGAWEAKGNVLFFLDADVKVPQDIFQKIAGIFSCQDVEAVQAVYAPVTPAKNFLSQYQNLYQHYNFNNIKETYLCRLSSYALAVKKEAFMQVGGFTSSVMTASVEDGFLGMAMYSRGDRLLLVKDIQVEHLACFDLHKILKRMFVMGREFVAYPWERQKFKRMKLSRTHHSPNRIVSIFLSPLALLLGIASSPALNILWMLCIVAFLMINTGFFLFLLRVKGAAFLLRSMGVYYCVCLFIFLGLVTGGVKRLFK